MSIEAHNFDIKPLMIEIEKLIQKGLNELLNNYIDRHNLLEETHKKIMELPSVVNELNKLKPPTNEPFLPTSVFSHMSSGDHVDKSKKYSRGQTIKIGNSPFSHYNVDGLKIINNTKTWQINPDNTTIHTNTKIITNNVVNNPLTQTPEIVKEEKVNIIQPLSAVDASEKEHVELHIIEDDSEIDNTDKYEVDVEEEKEAEEEAEQLEEVEVEVEVEQLAVEQVEVEVEEEEDEQVEEIEEEDEQVEVEIEEEDEQVEVEEEEQVEVEVEVEEEDEQVEVEVEDEEVEVEVEEDEKDEQVEVELEDEDIFEIEIEDETYCTNNEENGFIWKINDEGEQGEKVGYIKDGEPFFYADEE
jgi:hypothetical protein